MKNLFFFVVLLPSSIVTASKKTMIRLCGKLGLIYFVTSSTGFCTSRDCIDSFASEYLSSSTRNFRKSVGGHAQSDKEEELGRRELTNLASERRTTYSLADDVGLVEKTMQETWT